MKYRQLHDAYVVRFEKGEEVVSSLITFAKQHNIVGAFLYGLGGALSARLAMYLLDEQRYEYTDFTGPLEIASLTGNIARKADDSVHVHCHAVISSRDLAAHAGHLAEVVAGGTVEIFIDLRTQAMRRIEDQTVGLALLDLNHHDPAE